MHANESNIMCWKTTFDEQTYVGIQRKMSQGWCAETFIPLIEFASSNTKVVFTFDAKI